MKHIPISIIYKQKIQQHPLSVFRLALFLLINKNKYWIHLMFVNYWAFYAVCKHILLKEEKTQNIVIKKIESKQFIEHFFTVFE